MIWSIPRQRILLIVTGRVGTVVRVWVQPRGVNIIVIFAYIPTQQEKVEGTRTGINPTGEGIIGHLHTNENVVISIVIDVSENLISAHPSPSPDPVTNPPAQEQGVAKTYPPNPIPRLWKDK